MVCAADGGRAAADAFAAGREKRSNAVAGCLTLMLMPCCSARNPRPLAFCPLCCQQSRIPAGNLAPCFAAMTLTLTLTWPAAACPSGPYEGLDHHRQPSIPASPAVRLLLLSVLQPAPPLTTAAAAECQMHPQIHPVRRSCPTVPRAAISLCQQAPGVGLLHRRTLLLLWLLLCTALNLALAPYRGAVSVKR